MIILDNKGGEMRRNLCIIVVAILGLITFLIFSSEEKPGYYYKKGIKSAEKGDTEAAIKDWNKTIEVDSNFVVAYIARGDAYSTKRVMHRAINDYSKAISLMSSSEYPSSINVVDYVYMRRGIAYELCGFSDKALDDLKKAIELNPQNAVAHLNLGHVYANNSCHDQAIKSYCMALELDTKLLTAHSCRGLVYIEKGEYDKAIMDFSLELQLNPNNDDVYLSRGNAYYDKGDYDAAIKDYSKAIVLNSNNQESYLSRGMIYFKQNDLNKALSDLNTFLELGKEHEMYNKAESLIKEIKSKLKEQKGQNSVESISK
jgi:tetratricopeptide (TPR) repeat protein